MDESDWRLRPMHASLGVEIGGIDLKSADHTEARRMEALLDSHSVLLIRNQTLSEVDLVRFSRLFGELDEAPVNETGKTAVPGFPELYVISNLVGDDGIPIGSLGAVKAAWHTDMSYLDSPPRASLLHAIEVLASGGNTWLAGMYAALNAMPDYLRRRIEGRRIEGRRIEGRRIKHDGTYNSGGFVRRGLQDNDDPLTAPGTYHPAICRHPGSGRDVLFLGRRRNAHVEGLALPESEALLDALWAHATGPVFTYSHHWHVGDVIIWDNRATLHRRDAFDPRARRYLLRTQIKCRVPPKPADPKTL